MDDVKTNQMVPLVHDCDALLIRSARVIDPFSGRDEIADLSIEGGRIVDSPPANAKIIDATGCIVCPGLMDIHIHLREPGQAHKETIESGCASAAAGGFTFVACMPNTAPPLDDPETIQSILNRARTIDYAEVGPVATITRGRAGNTITDFAALLEAGAVAFSDDGTGVESDDAMRSAFIQSAQCDAVLIQHCEYKALSNGGVMHLGEVSRKINLPGLDPRSEEAMIERDIALCRETKGRYHVAHISTAKAVELVRKAKAEGLPVTAEVCTHHLVLTDEACRTLNTNTKMHPPLRPEADVVACRQGLVDGTIDCIVTDHAPHAISEKNQEFTQAPPGIVGLETALSLAVQVMIESGTTDWPELIGWFTKGPAAVLGRQAYPILLNSKANLSIIDPAARWKVDPDRFLTLGRSTPFSGWDLPARSLATVRGRRILSHPDSPVRFF